MGTIAKPLLLTTSSVAELLQVSPSTVKRWCEEGSLESRRTPGGHRRITLSDALDTARARGISTFLDYFHPWESNVWLALTDVATHQEYARLHNLALAWLARGETELMGRLWVEVARRPEISFSEFLDRGIQGFMSLVGREWLKGRLAIGEEHMATQTIFESFIHLRPGWLDPRPSMDVGEPPPVAVVGAMEGDQHELGAMAIRVLLEREGWRVYYLGGNVPVEELAKVQRAHGASLVCISFSPNRRLPDLRRAVRVLGGTYRPDLPYSLVLGGGMEPFSEHQIPDGPFESCTVSRSAGDFLDWLKRRSGTEAPNRSWRVA